MLTLLGWVRLLLGIPENDDMPDWQCVEFFHGGDRAGLPVTSFEYSFRDAACDVVDDACWKFEMQGAHMASAGD